VVKKGLSKRSEMNDIIVLQRYVKFEWNQRHYENQS
jgi:hypothetical protein